MITKEISLIVLLISGAWASADEFVSESTRPTLIELYTSEGCSSCPAADRWLSSLKAKPGLWSDFIPLAFHVDYWNYLGWRDEFASAANSSRQRRHRDERHIGSVYTPGFVINGREWRGFFNPLTRNNALPLDPGTGGRLKLSAKANVVTLSYSSGAPATLLVANVVYLSTDQTTRVTRGENRGKSLHHDFVVLAHLSSTGQNHWQFKLARPETSTAIAAWLSKPDDLTPIQAVGGWLTRP